MNKEQYFIELFSAYEIAGDLVKNLNKNEIYNYYQGLDYIENESSEYTEIYYLITDHISEDDLTKFFNFTYDIEKDLDKLNNIENTINDYLTSTEDIKEYLEQNIDVDIQQEFKNKLISILSYICLDRYFNQYTNKITESFKMNTTTEDLDQNKIISFTRKALTSHFDEANFYESSRCW